MVSDEDAALGRAALRRAAKLNAGAGRCLAPSRRALPRPPSPSAPAAFPLMPSAQAHLFPLRSSLEYKSELALSAGQPHRATAQGAAAEGGHLPPRLGQGGAEPPLRAHLAPGAYPLAPPCGHGPLFTWRQGRFQAAIPGLVFCLRNKAQPSSCSHTDRTRSCAVQQTGLPALGGGWLCLRELSVQPGTALVIRGHGAQVWGLVLGKRSGKLPHSPEGESVQVGGPCAQRPLCRAECQVCRAARSKETKPGLVLKVLQGPVHRAQAPRRGLKAEPGGEGLG